MYKKIFFLICAIYFGLSSCSPKLTSSILKSYPSLDYKENVVVLGLNQSQPSGSEEIGELEIKDAGFSTNCSFEAVIEKAKLEARRAGGNAIKITRHTAPSAFGSSCHQIRAKILKVDHPEELKEDEGIVLNTDYAIVNVYRYGGPGSLINYDLYLGDTVICRVRNNFKATVHVKKDGLNRIWARTESKAEIPINIKIGREYFIKCGVGMGAFVGRPLLEMVDPKTGKLEFESFNAKNK